MMDDAATASDRLRYYLDCARAIIERRAEANEDLKALFAQAKAEGFDTRTMRAVLARSEQDPEIVRNNDSMLETYEAALGCGAYAGAEQDLVQGEDGVHRPASEVRLLELLTRPPEFWPAHADAEYLVQVVELVEALFDQRDAINAQVRQVLKAAEANGLEPKGIRTIVAQRAMDPDKRLHQEGIVAAYRFLLGIEGPTGPVRLPAPAPAGSIAAPKKLTAKERQFREAMAITIATQSFSTH